MGVRHKHFRRRRARPARAQQNPRPTKTKEWGEGVLAGSRIRIILPGREVNGGALDVLQHSASSVRWSACSAVLTESAFADPAGL